MARPIWKGMISFGLVSVPVALYPAEESHQLSFSMLDKRDFSPIGFKRYNKASGKEVTWDNIVKGYEYTDGEYVVLEFAPPSKNSYTHPDLIPETPFYYRVRPFTGPASSTVDITLPPGEEVPETDGHQWAQPRKGGGGTHPCAG